MSTPEQLQQRSATSATPMQRADEPLRQMTVEEKAMQLSAVYPLALLGPEPGGGLGGGRAPRDVAAAQAVALVHQGVDGEHTRRLAGLPSLQPRAGAAAGRAANSWRNQDVRRMIGSPSCGRARPCRDPSRPGRRRR
jgi:hypothetical protein